MAPAAKPDKAVNPSHVGALRIRGLWGILYSTIIRKYKEPPEEQKQLFQAPLVSQSTLLILEDVVQEGGFARAEKAGENGHLFFPQLRPDGAEGSRVWA